MAKTRPGRDYPGRKPRPFVTVIHPEVSSDEVSLEVENNDPKILAQIIEALSLGISFDIGRHDNPSVDESAIRDFARDLVLGKVQLPSNIDNWLEIFDDERQRNAYEVVEIAGRSLGEMLDRLSSKPNVQDTEFNIDPTPNKARLHELCAHRLLPFGSLLTIPQVLDVLIEETGIDKETISSSLAIVDAAFKEFREVILTDLFSQYETEKANHFLPNPDAPVVSTSFVKPPPSNNGDEAVVEKQKRLPDPQAAVRRKQRAAEREARLEVEAAENKKRAAEILERISEKVVEVEEQARNYFETQRTEMELLGNYFTHRFLDTPFSSMSEDANGWNSRIMALGDLEAYLMHLELLRKVCETFDNHQIYDLPAVLALQEIVDQYTQIADVYYRHFDLSETWEMSLPVLTQAAQAIKKHGLTKNLDRQWRSVLALGIQSTGVEVEIPTLKLNGVNIDVTSMALGIPSKVLAALRVNPQHWIGECIPDVQGTPVSITQYQDKMDIAGSMLTSVSVEDFNFRNGNFPRHDADSGFLKSYGKLMSRLPLSQQRQMTRILDRM